MSLIESWVKEARWVAADTVLPAWRRVGHLKYLAGRAAGYGLACSEEKVGRECQDAHEKIVLMADILAAQVNQELSFGGHNDDDT